MKPLDLRRAARREFDEAVAWYEGKRPGLGREFTREVESAFQSIRISPERFAKVDGDVREAIVDRFPFVVYFRIRDKRIEVISVFHTSRDPLTWQSRI